MSTEFFIIYDLALGTEIMRGSGPVGTAAIQRPPEGFAALALPQGAMEIDLADAAEFVRAALLEKLRLNRNAFIAGGVDTPFGRFDSEETDDKPSRTNVLGYVVAALCHEVFGTPLDPEVQFTRADNTDVDLEPIEMVQVGLLMMAHVKNTHARANAIKAAIQAAGSVTELLQIDVAALAAPEAEG